MESPNLLSRASSLLQMYTHHTHLHPKNVTESTCVMLVYMSVSCSNHQSILYVVCEYARNPYIICSFMILRYSTACELLMGIALFKGILCLTRTSIFFNVDYGMFRALTHAQHVHSTLACSMRVFRNFCEQFFFSHEFFAFRIFNSNLRRIRGARCQRAFQETQVCI